VPFCPAPDHDVRPRPGWPGAAAAGPTGASRQDRDVAKPLLWNPRKAFPSVKLA